MSGTMKHRKALLSEEELLVRKERDEVHKASKRASETFEHTIYTQARTEPRASETPKPIMISVNTHCLACTEGSALQCCSLYSRKEVAAFTDIAPDWGRSLGAGLLPSPLGK